MREKPLIFEYTDYRDFLRDLYRHCKSLSPQSFSYRSFALRTQMSSPNYLKRVIDKERHLSVQTLHRFAKAFQLKNNEVHFFELLVHYTKAKTAAQKEFYFTRMRQFKKFRLHQNLLSDQYDYFSRWYIPAIREMVLLKNFKEDARSIAKRFDPPLQEKEVSEAIELLLRLGLLIRDRSGRLALQEPNLSTGAEISSASIWRYHREMLGQAIRALEQPAKERNIACMTLSVSQKQYERLKEKIQGFFAEIGNWIDEEKEPRELVCQLNIQQFKLTP